MPAASTFYSTAANGVSAELVRNHHPLRDAPEEGEKGDTERPEVKLSSPIIGVRWMGCGGRKGWDEPRVRGTSRRNAKRKG